MLNLTVHCISLPITANIAFFRDIQEPFQNAARIQPGPHQVDYAELLSLIASGHSLAEEGILFDVLSIYERIGHYLKKHFDQSKFEKNILFL